ncbi:alkylation response protein AidB-like acyl-CoA dehydrogenase [Kibdelosporangium phytohabitans]|uniref:Butyryl-CoA dehydrogenase n=2 Tax=Kibdelosporangium phytohabitans TaxID=860235 RepID=A0A0N7F583_9PSEU|nr:butyryl-CoA dehydrogenase [Kibdelosporangium phytohabitans]MBE1465362.1 alkylation response protein AidB-like acyl-CoA dehydrogenase [Kibdelosporangium phytohabitans]
MVDRHKRDAMGIALAVLNRIAGARLVRRFGLEKPIERGVFHATRTGFRTLGAATRSFQAVSKLGKPARLPSAPERGLFDLTPDEDQRMIRDTVAEFATEQLRPAAAEADTACKPPAELLSTSAELGLAMLGVPEELGGAGSERSTVSGALIAEALAHGDMGLAVACLAPSAVSNALVLWGDGDQQAMYLPAFVGDNVPAAALAILEPRPLFDPFALKTTARRTPEGYRIEGVKSLVPRAAEAELFVVAAELDGTPALFIVESTDVQIEAEPAMGLRAAAMGRLVLDNVTVPRTALLGGGAKEVYADCVRLSRLGWCALAVGTAQAVLDYVIPYVNERVAFGEPVSHRQSVAFKVADIGIELDGMRLVTYRAAARAEQGLPFAREVGLARKLCADKGMVIGSDGVQLLGGHGFVKEHPVERWYRDLRAVGLMEGAVLL